MSRKKFKNMLTELCRRVYLQHNGTLKGFGTVARFYDGTWKKNDSRSYKEIWDCDEMKHLRRSVNM